MKAVVAEPDRDRSRDGRRMRIVRPAPHRFVGQFMLTPIDEADAEAVVRSGLPNLTHLLKGKEESAPMPAASGEEGGREAAAFQRWLRGEESTLEQDWWDLPN